jgi:hypothetical protein
MFPSSAQWVPKFSMCSPRVRVRENSPPFRPSVQSHVGQIFQPTGYRTNRQTDSLSLCVCLRILFLLIFGWRGLGEDFFHFSFVPSMFLSSAQWVPKFPICSPRVRVRENSPPFRPSVQSHVGQIF